jgi:hypothetical protein
MKDDISLQDIQDKLKDACRETKERKMGRQIYPIFVCNLVNSFFDGLSLNPQNSLFQEYFG